MDNPTYQALLRILAHLLPDEYRHWHEAGLPVDHIFVDLLALQLWMIEHKRCRV
jgi:hypothetical protein